MKYTVVFCNLLYIVSMLNFSRMRSLTCRVRVVNACISGPSSGYHLRGHQRSHRNFDRRCEQKAARDGAALGCPAGRAVNLQSALEETHHGTKPLVLKKASLPKGIILRFQVPWNIFPAASRKRSPWNMYHQRRRTALHGRLD